MAEYQPGDQVVVVRLSGHPRHCWPVGTVLTIKEPYDDMGRLMFDLEGPHPDRRNDTVGQIVNAEDVEPYFEPVTEEELEAVYRSLTHQENKQEAN